MKFREKIKLTIPFSPDILVIPECEAPEKWVKSSWRDNIEQFLWFGNNKNKGLGILSLSSKYTFEVHPDYKKEYQYIIPLKVCGDEEFIILAVWSQNMKKQYYSYIGQIYLALKHYETLLSKPCFIIGDWNSNKIFDCFKRVGTHSDVVEKLIGYDIHSIYHKYFNEEQGKESRPTYYFRKEQERPFHIDYIFGSRRFYDRLVRIEVGTYDDWIQYSDHMPICAEFK